MSTKKYDIAVLGGGLSGCLLASRLASLEKKHSILVIEKDNHLGGKHTWSFHETDIPDSLKEWFFPLVSKMWESHTVYFPKYTRNLKGRYGSIRSEDLNLKIQKQLGIDFAFGKNVSNLNEINANCIIDARGFEKVNPETNAYQKFFGLNVRLKNPHGLKAPILMDATVEQIDGYRFMYVLPWNETDVLFEDTYYSDTPELSKETIRERIFDYVKSKGWEIAEVLEEEIGVLPIPLFEEYRKEHALPTVGVRMGGFNRTTGFSLPVLLQLIEKIVQSGSVESDTLRNIINNFVRSYDSQHRRFCFLNRVLFRAKVSDLRYEVLQDFYRLPEDLISRFYSCNMRSLDWLRFFMRKPPAPIGKALQVGFKKRVLAHGKYTSVSA